MTRRSSLLWQAAALAALVFAVYGNTLRGQLVGYDDVQLLEESRSFSARFHPFHVNSSIPSSTTGQVLLQVLKAIPSRLLRDLSYRFDDRLAQASGLQPNFVLHLANVLWHLLACLLAWQVARRLLPEPGWAWLAAALFAAHPLQCESVAYIAGRRDLMLGVFYLAALASYIEFRRRSSRGWLALAAGCWFLALNAKETAVTLPAACWLYDLYAGKARRLDRRVLAGGLLLTLAGALAVLSHMAGSPWTLNGGGATTHLLTAGSIVWRALRLFVWPSTLIAQYDRAPFLLVSNPLAAGAWLKAVLLLAAAAYAQTLWKSRPLPAFAAAFFALTFLPTSGLIPWGELFAEHWLYLPLFGLCLAAAWAAGLLHRRLLETPLRAAAPVLSAAVLIALSARAAARNLDWKNADTLWTKTVADTPWSPRARFGLGTIDSTEGKINESLTQYRAGLALGPAPKDAALAYANMAHLYAMTGQPDKALRLLQAAAPLDPGDWLLNYNLGALEERAGRPDLADAAYRRTINANPRFAEAYNNLSALYFAKGDLRAAARFCAEALAVRPNDPAFLDNLGFIHDALGHPSVAEHFYLQAIRWNKDPGLLKPYYHLAHLYWARGEQKRADAVMRSIPKTREKTKGS